MICSFASLFLSLSFNLSMHIHRDKRKSNHMHPHMGAAAMNIYIPHAIVILVLLQLLFLGFLPVNETATVPMDMSTAILLRVDQSGNGDFKKIQDAIDAVPPNNSQLYFIWVKPGTYRENIVVPADKPFITLSGTQASNTIITWSDTGDIFDSATLTILASDFVGRYLTIQNTFGTSGKAVAMRVSGDRAAFFGCSFLSYQDTLLDDAGKHYFSNCYIEGATDFIFGNAASLYQRCHLHSLSTQNGSITAQHRNSPSETTGFTFLGCRITGTGAAFLGRPWGDYSRVIFALSYMPSVILPKGWDDWQDPRKHSTVYYGEYKCYGPGADTSKRVNWSRRLSDDEAAQFLTTDFIGGRGWLRPVPTNFKRPPSIMHCHCG